MIKLIYGNVGSGKTASMVLYMKNNPHKTFITNIHVRGQGFKHVMLLKAEMIIKKEVTGVKRNGKEVYKATFNKEFWQDLIKKHGEMNIIIDEAHAFGLNPRRSMSSLNLVMTDFVALIRRVLGSADNTGDAFFISQLSHRLDPKLRDMAEKVFYMINHYICECSICHQKWAETNETARKFELCPRCRDYRFKKIHSEIEVFEFASNDKFIEWKDYKIRSYYNRYIQKNIMQIYGNYDTVQIDDILSQY
jgi:hypothetical protein